jgi:hypothetical protein
MQADLFRRGQESGELRAGDPVLLARMFSGLVSAFQAEELAAAERAGKQPRRKSPGSAAGEWVPLAVLHEVLEAAFGT